MGLDDAPVVGRAMSGPGWYEKLPRKARDAWDQTGHFWMCFGIAAVGSAAAAWGFMHWREFDAQAPIERIEDTRRDMRFGIYGAIPGQLVFSAWTTAVILWAVG